MPTYCYKCECGEAFERAMPISRRSPLKCPSCSALAHRDYRSELLGHRRPQPGTWPMEGGAFVGVAAEDAASHARKLKEKGVHGVEVKANGDLVFSDRRAYKNWCVANHLYNRDAGYGDATPTEYKGR